MLPSVDEDNDDVIERFSYVMFSLFKVSSVTITKLEAQKNCIVCVLCIVCASHHV